MGSIEKHLETGECFVVRCPLVPHPTINREHAHVKNELVCVFNNLFAVVRRRSGVGVHNSVINLPPENLNWVGGGIQLTETLVMCEPVRISNNGVRCVRVGEQIQHTEYAVAQVWRVEDMDKVFFGGAYKLLSEGAVHILEGVECNFRCVVRILEGCCFRSGGAYRDDGLCSGIGLSH